MTQKLGAFYGACMDEAGATRAGTQPLRGLIADVAQLTDTKSLSALVAELHTRGIWPLFQLSLTQNADDATRYVEEIDQGGLGLPDRDYYVRRDEASLKLVVTYREHIARMLRLLGLAAARATAAAGDVLRLETALAKVSKTNVERRDPKANFNRMDRQGVTQLTPAFDWDTYWRVLGYPEMHEFSVTTPKFLEGIQGLLLSTRPSVWQSYLLWCIVRDTAQLLSPPFVDESFRMRQALTGELELPPRFRRCVRATDRTLGDLLAQPYVRQYFPGASRQSAEGIVEAIGAAFSADLDTLDWLDAETRPRAHKKLSSFTYLIGYPSHWKSYDYLVDRESYAQNALRSRSFELKRDLSKVGKAVDPNEWQMTAPTADAWYDPQHNHMLFPAGILQPPLYSIKQALPENLGGVGMVMGHELSHGFDDQGAQFDEHGNLRNWWTPAVAERFKAKTACFNQQYSAYEAQPGLHLNGALTLGENIADNGGLKLAFAAYKALQSDAPDELVADGFSEDQQFFIAFAQSWCASYRPDFERLIVQTNAHAPPRFRVRGALSNLPQFAQSFGCKEGSPMHPKATCSVW